VKHRSPTHAEYTAGIARKLSNPMEQSPSRGATTSSAIQHTSILRILCIQKVHCSVHNGPQLVFILPQINPVHATPSCIFNIYFNIILLSMLTSSKPSLSFKRSYQQYECISFLPYVPHANPILSSMIRSPE
jgi:hypothetical protein